MVAPVMIPCPSMTPPFSKSKAEQGLTHYLFPAI